MNENREHCKHIADQLEAIAEGRMYICPECGEFIHIPETAQEFTCPACGSGDLDQPSMLDFFADCYDIEYRINSRKEYKSVRLMVAYGGPNIFVDTASAEVQLFWWSDRESFPISRDVSEAIDEAFEELYNC